MNGTTEIPSILETWTPEEVNNTIAHTVRHIAAAAVVIVVAKNVSQFFQFTGRDLAYTFMQKKLYKSF